MGEVARNKSFHEIRRSVLDLLKKVGTSKVELGKILVIGDLCDDLQSVASSCKEYRLESEVFHSVTKLGIPAGKADLVKDIVNKLSLRLSTEPWAALGRGVNIRADGGVGATTWLGALEVQQPRKQYRKRVATKPKVLEKPNRVEDVKDCDDPTTRRTETLYKAILANGSTPFAEAVLDMGSLGNTILNVFCLQLLVNRGRIVFSKSESKGMVVTAQEKSSKGSCVLKCQRILQINRHVWDCMREVVRAEDCLMQVTKAKLPCRSTQSAAADGGDHCVTPAPGPTTGNEDSGPSGPESIGERRAARWSCAGQSQAPFTRKGQGPSGAQQENSVQPKVHGLDRGNVVPQFLGLDYGRMAVDAAQVSGQDNQEDDGVHEGVVMEVEESLDDDELPSHADVNPRLPDIHFQTILSQANGRLSATHGKAPGGSKADASMNLKKSEPSSNPKKRKLPESGKDDCLRTPQRASQGNQVGTMASGNASEKLKSPASISTPPKGVQEGVTQTPQSAGTLKRVKTSPLKDKSPGSAKKQRRQEQLRIEAEKRNKDPRPVQERLNLKFPHIIPACGRQMSITECISRMNTPRRAPRRAAPAIVGAEPEEDEKKPIIDLCIPSAAEEEGPIVIDLTGNAPIVKRIHMPDVIDLS